MNQNSSSWSRVRQGVDFVASVLTILGFIVAVIALWPSFESITKDDFEWKFNTLVQRHEGGGESCLVSSGLVVNQGRSSMTILAFTDRETGVNIPYFAEPATNFGVSDTLHRSQPFSLDPGQSALVTLVEAGTHLDIRAKATMADGRAEQLGAPSGEVSFSRVNTKTSAVETSGDSLPLAASEQRRKIVEAVNCDTQTINTVGGGEKK